MAKAILTSRNIAANEWHAQWSMFQDDAQFLFEDWIFPVRLEDLRDKVVLECGCGGGQHTNIMTQIARSVTAVDLSTTDIARIRNRNNTNVEFVQADIASMNLGHQYDVVLCVGAIHHTDDPDSTFQNIYRHCKPGGKVVIWTYATEGNALVRFVVEPLRKICFRFLPRKLVAGISVMITALLYPIVYSIYRIPWLSRLPYYDYFSNFRRLSFRRNVLNVFDKLNAPQTKFTTREKCQEWFNGNRFVEDSISIRHYKGVSWSLVGTKRHE
jgi:SAM-dependent methyltransferase